MRLCLYLFTLTPIHRQVNCSTLKTLIGQIILLIQLLVDFLESFASVQFF